MVMWDFRLIMPYDRILIGFLAILSIVTFVLYMQYSKTGRAMRALAQDRVAAQLMGVNVERYSMIGFALGAMLAAAAGVLVVPIQQAHYLMGLDPLLLSFIVVILGGLGSLTGTVIAAFVIGLSDGIISVFFSPTRAKILATLLVAVVLIFRPGGLFGDDQT